MVDFVKKEWQFRDVISEDELNRMEDGIEEGITKAEQAQQTADDAVTAAANAQSDIDVHLTSSTPHATVKDVNLLGFSQVEPIQISDGAISVTRTFHVIDTEGEASTDELDTINGGGLHDILILQLANVNRKITIKNVSSQGIGNIRTFDGTDIVLDHHYASVLLIKRNANEWAAFPVGVKRSGDTMTGDLQLQGTNVLLRLPETAPTWARGLYLRDPANTQSIASFGFLGSGSNFERLFFGIGENPWSINSVGVWLRPDGRLSYVNSGTEHSLWHAGNLPVESGNWTVTLSGQTTPGTPTYTTRTGRYYRVGRLVHIYFACTISNKGGMSGRLVLGGLPFLAATGSGGMQSITINVMNVTYPTNAREVFGGLSASEPNIIFTFRASDGSLIVVDTNHIDDSFEIRGSATYLID